MYDITIIGAGVSGIFTAYTLVSKNEKLDIKLIDIGNPIEKRICKIKSEGSYKCKNCDVCNKFLGFGGLGKSEGKFNYTSDFGGDLQDLIGENSFNYCMSEVDNILKKFGGDKVNLYSTYNESFQNKLEKQGFKVLTSKVRHLGTKLSNEIIKGIEEYLNERVSISLNTNVKDISKEGENFVLSTNKEIFKSRKVVLATGYTGLQWLQRQCKKFNIKFGKTRVDLGFRIEFLENDLKEITKETLETKLSLKVDNTIATTYCMNPKGRVIKKYQRGFVFADGQNYLEGDGPTLNTNFTLFIPKYFPSGKAGDRYVKNIMTKINSLDKEIVMQRLGDLINNRSTTKEKILNNSVTPTLNCNPGNLNEIIPKEYINITIEFFKRLEKIIKKPINKDAILYGLDAKFYNPYIHIDKTFQNKIEGLFFIGDCSGVTYSLSQAAASGVYLGNIILNNCI
ncbi:hypothetical protein [Clostridium oceanicum]|uniref:NAD(P)-binding protein n=1 Tax=Clostridium oceanicum TaxID=1543 RepID=A0ABP3UEJ5_9CLOT